MKVLITSNSFARYDESPKKEMLDKGWELIENRYHYIMNEAEMMKEVVDVDAIILGSDTVSKKVLEKANKLKMISRYGVGLDNVDLEEAQKRNIKITTTKNCNTQAAADFTIGLMLSTLRHICNVDQNLKKGIWSKETGMDLCNKTVGVFGLGAIGREVVKRLEGFSCTILGYDTHIDQEYCKTHHIEVLTPDEIIQRADIITLHIPGNQDGSHFINEREINMMKQQAVLINTARASLIDESALLHALKEKRIYGYGSDVFANEPHIDPQFQSLQNVVLSPHNAAVSVEAIHKMSQLAVNHIVDFFQKNA